MGYHHNAPILTTQTRTPAFSRARPKTHTPCSTLQDRGLRYYNPEVGRWVSRDPIGEFVEISYVMPLSDLINEPYVFVNNNTANDVDLIGLASFKFPKIKLPWGKIIKTPTPKSPDWPFEGVNPPTSLPSELKDAIKSWVQECKSGKPKDVDNLMLACWDICSALTSGQGDAIVCRCNEKCNQCDPKIIGK